MKGRTVALIIIVIILAVIILSIITERARGDNGGKLSWEAIAQIMSECYQDVSNIRTGTADRNDNAHVRSRLAVAIFYYRTGMIPAIQ